MRALIQRVRHARVEIDDQIVGEIEQGLMVLLGIQKGDDQAIADKLLHKLINYRVFADSDDKMNLNLQQVEGGLLLVSQFTLAADTKKGLRPGFSSAAAPADAVPIYDYFVAQAKQKIKKTDVGEFGADMQVHLQNDGPVTFLLEI